MKNEFKFLFEYLKVENITIDKNEFLFQVQSNPNFPSLLSIADTLHFFNIDNLITRIDFIQINSLPDTFCALLKDKNGVNIMSFIKKKDSFFYITNSIESIKVKVEDLEKKWIGIVLVVEKEIIVEKKSSINKEVILFGFSIAFFLIVFFDFKQVFLIKFFYAFPILGVVFSVFSLKELFGFKSEFINNICNIGSFSDCSSVIKSNKWKVFKYFNYSDLSIVFFSSQFVALFFFSLMGNVFDFFYIQKTLFFLSIPILITSIYYQIIVEKKMCPICLLIIATFVLEFLYIKHLINLTSNFSITSIYLYSFILTFVGSIWFSIKHIIENNKELMQFKLEANRFSRNYSLFKNNIISNKKIEFTKKHIVIGNVDCRKILTVITNPFCNYCKDVHFLIDDILLKYNDDIQVQIIFNVDIDNENEDVKNFLRRLFEIYNEDGAIKFQESLSFWFIEKEIKKWLNIYGISKMNNMQTDLKFFEDFNWCATNDLNYTPIVFLNGYQYPSFYNKKDLIYFIDDFIDDSVFN